MAAAARKLQPELSPLHLFGARLRALRDSAGLSQTELGRRVTYSGHLIGKVETGLRRPSADLVQALDRELHANGELSRLALNFDEPAAGAVAAEREAASLLGSLRRVLDLRDDPEDGPVRDLATLRSEVDALVRMRLASDYRGLATRLPTLLPELHRAELRRPEPTIAGLLFQAYRAADAIADKLGQHDLSARLIDLLRASASATEEPLTIAAAEYVRGELFFVNGDFRRGEQLLDRAANHLSQAAHGATFAAAQAGALRMRAAVLAARGGDRLAAEDHIRTAVAIADVVPDGVYRGTAFGISSVRIHHLSLALDVGNLDMALEIADNWLPPMQIPAERRSHFFLDRALALQRARRPDDALDALALARQIAPQHVRPHPQTRAVLARLLVQARRPSDELARMWRWTGGDVNPEGAAGPEAQTES